MARAPTSRSSPPSLPPALGGVVDLYIARAAPRDLAGWVAGATAGHAAAVLLVRELDNIRHGVRRECLMCGAALAPRAPPGVVVLMVPAGPIGAKIEAAATAVLCPACTLESDDAHILERVKEQFGARVLDPGLFAGGGRA
jgi:hypothetical protein